jgi:hypothetical protein
MDSGEWGEWVEHRIGSKISTLTRAANPDSALLSLALTWHCIALSRSDKNVFPYQSARLSNIGVKVEES